MKIRMNTVRNIQLINMGYTESINLAWIKKKRQWPAPRVGMLTVRKFPVFSKIESNIRTRKEGFSYGPNRSVKTNTLDQSTHLKAENRPQCPKHIYYKDRIQRRYTRKRSGRPVDKKNRSGPIVLNYRILRITR